MAGGEGMDKAMKRPALTFPKSVAEYVCRAYSEADSILEYGSGGSTVLASEMDGKRIYAVESDKVWASNLKDYIRSSDATRSIPEIIYADVGPTTKWGHPENTTSSKKFHLYPLSIWNRSDLVAPDVALIDGRFRVACFFACMLSTQKNMTILFDDYTERPRYWIVEKFFKPELQVGRMAVFQIERRALAADSLLSVIGSFSDPS